MTASHSSRLAILEITTAAIGGAFLVLYGLGLYADLSFLTPTVWKIFGILGAVGTVGGIVLKADRRVIALSLIFAGAAFSGELTIRQHTFLPIAFMLAVSFVFVGYLVWFYRKDFGPFIGLSGAVSGAILLWALTSHFLRVTNSFVLVGAGLAYLMGRRELRDGQDSGGTYRTLLFTTILPCVLIFAIGIAGFGKWLYPLTAFLFIVGIGLNNVEAN